MSISNGELLSQIARYNITRRPHLKICSDRSLSGANESCEWKFIGFTFPKDVSSFPSNPTFIGRLAVEMIQFDVGGGSKINQDKLFVSKSNQIGITSIKIDWTDIIISDRTPVYRISCGSILCVIRKNMSEFEMELEHIMYSALYLSFRLTAFAYVHDQINLYLYPYESANAIPFRIQYLWRRPLDLKSGSTCGHRDI